MQKVNLSGGEAAAEQTVWCAREGSPVIVKRKALHTGSSAMCAKWHNKWSTMREKQDVAQRFKQKLPATVTEEDLLSFNMRQEFDLLRTHCPVPEIAMD